jgi:putative addiction module component (TIGR02574 family)
MMCAIHRKLLYNPGSTAKEDFTMLLTYQQVAQAAMQLSPDERVDLAEKLWVSVDTPEAIAAAWDEEIARRVAQLDAGEVETVPAEQVFAELRARLK